MSRHARPRAALLDIAGVLHEGGTTTEGAVEAVERLRRAGLGVRFVTNTSRKTRDATLAELRELGFRIERDEVYTAVLAARDYLRARTLRPYLVIHPDVAPDLAGLDTNEPNAVFVADAGEHFDYAVLDGAFAVLQEVAPLVAVGRNRYFRGEGRLKLDAGPFVAALEYAADCNAVITGKPSAAFFEAVLGDLGVRARDAVMIGDDAESDVIGALDAGLGAVQVRTGKFRGSDEARVRERGAAVHDNLAAAVEALLA